MWRNQWFHLGYFSILVSCKSTAPVRQGRNRRPSEREDKRGLLLVKCSRIMIGVSCVRAGWAWLTQVASPPQDIAVQTLRHAALHRWCTLDSLSSAVHNIPVCTVGTAAQTLFHFSFTLNVKYQQGVKIKEAFRKRTQCAKSSGFSCFLNAGWIRRSCATVHLSVSDDSEMLKDKYCVDLWFLNTSRRNRIRHVVCILTLSVNFLKLQTAARSVLSGKLIWQVGARQLHLDRSGDRRGKDKNKPRVGARFPV